MMLVATINVIIFSFLFSFLFSFSFSFFFFFSFFFLFSVVYFSHRRSVRIRKLIQRKLLRMVRRCRRCSVAGGEQAPPSPRGWYFSPLSTFLIEGVLGSKNLFCKSYLEYPKTQGQTPFQTLSAILGPPGGHFGFCRLCDVAGDEGVPPAPLGWFLCIFYLILTP